jgi:hypothetical protein
MKKNKALKHWEFFFNESNVIIKIKFLFINIFINKIIIYQILFIGLVMSENNHNLQYN